MSFFVLYCVSLALLFVQANAYTCTLTDYPNLAQGWYEMISPYCASINALKSDSTTTAQGLMNCVDDDKIPLMSSINECQKEFHEDPINGLQFLQILCTKNPKDMSLYDCCLTDKVLKAGSDPQAVERSSLYTKCLEKFFPNGR